MDLTPLQAKCPTCHSSDVFYTCHVTCCFNHVCNDCKTTFELATDLVRKQPDWSIEPPSDRDTSLPMAPCAECEGTSVFQVGEGPELFCADCRTVLTLRFEKVVADR